MAQPRGGGGAGGGSSPLQLKNRGHTIFPDPKSFLGGLGGGGRGRHSTDSSNRITLHDRSSSAKHNSFCFLLAPIKINKLNVYSSAQIQDFLLRRDDRGGQREVFLSPSFRAGRSGQSLFLMA